MKKWINSLMLLLLVGIAILGGCSQQTKQSVSSSNDTSNESSSATDGKVALSFATMSEGSAVYVYGATMSQILMNNVEQIERVDVLPYNGGFGNVTLLDTGKADLGITFDLNNFWARTGTGPSEKEYDNLRVLLGALDQYYVGVLMTNEFMEEYGIDSIADIKEKKIPARLLTLGKGSQGEVAAQQVLEAYGLSYEELEGYGGSVEHTSFDVVKTNIQDGRTDMFIQVMTNGHPAFTEIALQNPVTFMGIEDEYVEKLAEFGYSRATLPAGVFNGQDEEVPSVGLRSTVTTTTDLPEEIAYQFTKTLIEHQEDLATGHKGLEDFEPQVGITESATGGVEIHPGALRYYKEVGWIK
ncbi:TAXI family TRAP transporter solute-binding subunit [Bacillus sp. Marseille-P3661]|uniref:TAXI family TRAP transporter solute-binding subunit n=1 Tax=Bacillus sp. Marseille-P3661 TaxID=1936234 RepID=UPI000C858FD4|nr:TAXI family TRAP transporter solute-binding subunit [Bacillus sp. Marseille-P3661]